MATKTLVLTNPSSHTNFLLATWENLTNDGSDVGQALELPFYADKTVHIKGTFGTGGTCKIRGSNDGVTWIDLTDPQGNAISKTAEAIETITENPRYIRPEITAGDGSTDLDVFIACRSL